ncbi:DUF2922 domain-containing protein [Cellulosilyticum sp. I15G10I2]|uniref:DUF2922 domain-containing protein n=1 Tax=Cellulosilyticum sp. I15G10I2 TaxID=1892843 RepID=UPI00085BB574|nr:DUF2922 domain-containing protein [Cellulosilyticum sp. I15G10I2]
MAEITKKSLVLTFKTAGNKEVSLTITKPSNGITGQDISTAMDTMIAAGGYGDGDLVTEKLTAKYVTQQVENISLI